MSWTTTTLTTTADLAKIEREINDLVESSGNEYFSNSVAVSANSISDSVDCKGGMIEIIGKAETEITIKDGNSLTITAQHSQDDDTFVDLNNYNIVYNIDASGADETIAEGTIFFRFVVPTNVYDFIRFTITSDATNTGALDIYTISKWEEKINVAKNKIKNKLETHLVMRQYKDLIDFADGEELINIIANPETFSIASTYLTLHYIFRDLATLQDVDSMYYAKMRMYKKDFDEEFEEAVRRINYDYDQDGTVDDYKKDETPKLIL